jgi:hypothetical protein
VIRTFFNISNASEARGWGVLSGWMTVHGRTYAFIHVIDPIGGMRPRTFHKPEENVRLRQHVLEQ